MLQLNFSPFPLITTNRLVLREAVQADAPEIFFLRSDADVLQYINKEPMKTMEEAEAYIRMISDAVGNNEYISWAMSLLEQPQVMIGSIALWRVMKEHYRAEIGYVLHPSYHRKGLMDEALKSVIDYGFNVMNLHSIEANINPQNEGSRKLLEKHGFVQEGYFRENFCFRGQFMDSATFSLIRK